MKLRLIQHYYDCGELQYRYHETKDGKTHGLDEWFNLDGSIDIIRYFNLDKVVKLANQIDNDSIKINYHI